MGFVYEGDATCDGIVTGFCSNGLASGGANAEIVVPYRSHIMECGFVPQGASATSAMTMAVTVASNVVASGTFVSLITSGTGTFASGVLAEGAVASVSLSGSTILPKGASIKYTLSGGQSATIAAQVYAIVRRVNTYE